MSGEHAGKTDAAVLMEQRFDAGSLYALRAAVAAHATATGMARAGVYDVVSAAHELAANAVRHGHGSGRLRLWVEDGTLYCEVSDDGAAGNGQAPSVAAPWRVEHGHGLWLVEQVCDQFSIDHGPAGTSVVARFTLPR
jgi:anti-sigma regulatory factor (Ser/Thr protein kinase)